MSALCHKARTARDIQHVHSRGQPGLSERSSAIPDARAEACGLVDVAILGGRAVKQLVEKALPGLVLSIVLVKRRMGGQWDARTLSGYTLAATMGFGIHCKVRNVEDHL